MPQNNRPRLPGDPKKGRSRKLEPPSPDTIVRLVAAIIYLLAAIL